MFELNVLYCGLFFFFWREFALNLYKCSFWDGRMEGQYTAVKVGYLVR